MQQTGRGEWKAKIVPSCVPCLCECDERGVTSELLHGHVVAVTEAAGLLHAWEAEHCSLS